MLTILFAPAILKANDAEWESLLTIDVRGIFVTQDPLGNVYVISHDGNILKFDRSGNLSSDFRERRFGRPSMIDATNPLKILVLYPDFSNVIFLDNKLNLKGNFNLSGEGYADIQSIAFSSDNDFWLYDEIQRRLIKLADNKDIVSNSEDFGLLFDKRVRPVFMLERNRQVFAYDEEHGIFIFDFFAQYLQRLHFTGFRTFSVDGNWLYYIKDSFLNAYHLRSFQKQKVALPSDQYVAAHFKKNRLAVLTANQLTLYRKN